MATKKRGLGGKGLSSLLAGSKVFTGNDDDIKGHDGQLRELPVDLIQKGKYQPRGEMDEDMLEELASSIRKQGVMQPIIVRAVSEGRYEIIAGERRWRATQLAGLDRIPAIIRDVPDEAAIAMALIENIQRENLNAMEEARALQKLQDEFQLTQQEVADAVGKSRSTITNLLRLTTLCSDVRVLLEHGDLEMGHGRAMLTLTPEYQIQAAKQVIFRSLSVRQTEALVKKLQNNTSKAVKPYPLDPDIRALQERIAEKMGAKVDISHSMKGKGRVTIQYNSLDELDGILSHIR